MRREHIRCQREAKCTNVSFFSDFKSESVNDYTRLTWAHYFVSMSMLREFFREILRTRKQLYLVFRDKMSKQVLQLRKKKSIPGKPNKQKQCQNQKLFLEIPEPGCDNSLMLMLKCLNKSILL